MLRIAQLKFSDTQRQLMKTNWKGIQHFLYWIARNGLHNREDDGEARIIMIHNYLTLGSAILLSPFPLVFVFLRLYEGLYLCGVCTLALIIPFSLNAFHLFRLARFFGIFLGMLAFTMGVVLYGYNAGFQFGIMALLPLPILYFSRLHIRIVVILIHLVLCVGIIAFFHPQIPLYPAPEAEFTLQLALLFFCTLLIMSYFLSSDWINRIYKDQNTALIDQLMMRNEELKNFSYSTSHDLKQPLQNILNFVSLLKDKKSQLLDEEGTVFLNFVYESADRLNHLIDALLAHSVLGEKGTFEPTDFKKVLQEVRKDLRVHIQQSNGRLFVEPLPTILANKEEIRSVFLNLISNALKFAKEDSYPIIHVGGQDNGSHWLFFVQDNGIGIEKHLWGKIFQIFQKGHVNSEIIGSGIGLANCKKIVNLHGGDIWVESELGRGSSFFFTIKKMKPNDQLP